MSDLNIFLYDRVRLWIFVGLYATTVLVLYGFTHTWWGLKIASGALCGTPYGDRLNRKTLILYGSPFEQALVHGRIRAGDSVAAVRADYGLAREIPLGRYTLIWPGRSACCAGCVLYAKDGCLVVAHSQFMFGNVVHFDTLTRDEWVELRALEEQYYKDQAAARQEARMAVAGAVFFKEPWLLTYPDEPVELP
jgi:hypothetical protein